MEIIKIRGKKVKAASPAAAAAKAAAASTAPSSSVAASPAAVAAASTASAFYWRNMIIVQAVATGIMVARNRNNDRINVYSNLLLNVWTAALWWQSAYGSPSDCRDYSVMACAGSSWSPACASQRALSWVPAVFMFFLFAWLPFYYAVVARSLTINVRQGCIQ
jgi:hypothetical protein